MLNDRAFYKAERIEDIVSESIEYEQLHRAVSELPEVQRRRLKLYFFGELTYEQIAKLEGCTIPLSVRSRTAYDPYLSFLMI